MCATSKLPEQEELPKHPWQLLKQLPTTDDETYWKRVILHYHLNPDNYPSSCKTTMKEKAEGLLKQAALGKLASFVGDARKIRDLPFIDPEKEQIPDQPIVLMMASNGVTGVNFRYAIINEGGAKKAKTGFLIERFGRVFCGSYLVLKAQEEWLKDLLKGKPVEHDMILALAVQEPTLTRSDFRDLCNDIGVYDGVDFRAKYQLR
ncbi:MAG: hypothetical protein JSR80_01645 [Verrucomicrobia bacterium]|nr:hypothetical protein [Verrucomicrobiota bacterium]